MCGLKSCAWVVVLAMVFSTPVFAQTGGISSGGQPGGMPLGGGSGALTPGGTSGQGGLGTGGQGGRGGQGTSGFGSSGFGSSGNQNSNLSGAGNLGQDMQFTNIGINGGGSGISASNPFGRFYANPMAIGLASNGGQTTNGGFGQPTFGNTAGGVGGVGGRGGTNTGLGTGGAGGLGAGGLGGRGGLGAGGLGAGGLGNRGGMGAGGLGGGGMNNQSGIVVPMPVQMTYTSQLGFAAPAITAPALHTDIRSSIDRTSRIANSKNVQVLIDQNNNVTLRGNVSDVSEIRLIEGMVRMTPGVGQIVNELKVPTDR